MKSCITNKPVSCRCPVKLIVVYLILLCLLSGGCGKEEGDAGSSVLNFIHHPEAYIRTEGMPEFGELLGEINAGLKQAGIMGDLRRGFKWDWSQPLAFEVELPSLPVLTFEWGFSPEIARFTKNFKLSVTVTQGRKVEVVTERQGVAGLASDGTLWRFEKIGLSGFKPGMAEISFEMSGPSKEESGDYFLLGCPRIHAADGEKKKHVIFIAVDTLRADHMSCYGYERRTTSSIDEWEKDGTRWEYCLSTSPWTFPSFASMLTARYPSICGGTTNIRFLPGDETTLAEVFSREGYATFSIVNSGWLAPAVNLHQGFDGTVQFKTGPCPQTFGYAGKWIESHADVDTFTFLHFMDPHQLYNPPPPFNTMYDPGYTGTYRSSFGGDVIEQLRNGEMTLSDSEIHHAEALYDGEITFFDSEFRKFLEFLDETGIADETLLIFTSDHGEEFFEHGGFEHGHSLYDEVLLVPLIISGMGFPRGVVSDRIVSTVDIFPTVLDFLEISIPDGLNGFSLLSPPPENDRMLIAEQLLYGEELKGVTSPEYRYIYHTVSGEEELYDLADDMDMLNSVAADRRATARSYRSFIANYTIGKGTPWHLFFMRGIEEGAPYIYSGTVTCKGGFAGVEKFKFDEDDTLEIAGNRIDFSIALKPSYEKEIRFVTNEEAAEVSFNLSKNHVSMEKGGIFIGPELDEITGAVFALDISDERFNLGQPNLRRRSHDGVFIWAIPTRLREQLQPDLTPEMEAELRSLGYLQ